MEKTAGSGLQCYLKEITSEITKSTTSFLSYCRDGFELNGARAGMRLEKVKSILGQAPVRTEEFADGRKAYVLEYTFEDYIAQFVAYDRDGSDDGTSFLRVLPRQDLEARLKRAARWLTGGEQQAGLKGTPAENPVKSGWRDIKYRETRMAEVLARAGSVPVQVGTWEAGFKIHVLEYPIGEGAVCFISCWPERNDSVSRVVVVPRKNRRPKR